MPRPYRLLKRAASAEQTRRRIIDAAREVLTEPGTETASLEEVAKRAGVTRATVYAKFANKRELLLTVVNEGLDRANVQRVRKALQHPDAATAIRNTLRASTQFWESERRLFGRVKALAAGDRQAAEIDALKEQVRRGHIQNITHRLAEQGYLRPELSERDAATLLLTLTSFETYAQIRIRDGYSLERTIGVLTHVLDTSVLSGSERSPVGVEAPGNGMAG